MYFRGGKIVKFWFCTKIKISFSNCYGFWFSRYFYWIQIWVLSYLHLCIKVRVCLIAFHRIQFYRKDTWKIKIYPPPWKMNSMEKCFKCLYHTYIYHGIQKGVWLYSMEIKCNDHTSLHIFYGKACNQTHPKWKVKYK